jgi:hypothetical protein
MSEISSIRKARKKIIAHINKCVIPHLYRSGYVDDNKSGELLKLAKIKPVKLSSCDEKCDIIGENWASTDSWSGGLCTSPLNEFKIDDLVVIMIHVLDESNFIKKNNDNM